MGYETRSGDPAADRNVILDLWQGSLAGSLSRERKFLTHYEQCPWGTPEIEILDGDGIPVGVAAVQPRSMYCGAQPVRAGLLIDFAVSPAHRSVGPALKLQKALLARCDGRYDVIYGLPNENARALSKRAGMREVGSMVRFVKVLRYGRYVRSYLPEVLASLAGRVLDGATGLASWLRRLGSGGMATSWVDTPVAEIDELWQASKRGDCMLAPRDARRLAWRLAPAGAPRTRYLLVRGTSGGGLEGWFACQRLAESLKIFDYWTRDATRGTSRVLLDALIATAAGIGCASISIELLAPDVVLQSWIAAGFIARESRPVFAKWSGPPGSGAPPPSMFLTSADEDE